MKQFVCIVVLITMATGCSGDALKKNYKDVKNDTGTKAIKIVSYEPLTCETGIQLEKIYGIWRTIGDEINDATYRYQVNRIDSSGNWIIDNIDIGKSNRRYTGRIKSINKNDYTVEVESEHGIADIEILNLTENCFDYRHKASNTVWRMDRVK